MRNYLGDPTFWTPQQKVMVGLMERLEELSAGMDERLDWLESESVELSKDLAWMEEESEEGGESPGHTEVQGGSGDM